MIKNDIYPGTLVTCMVTSYDTGLPFGARSTLEMGMIVRSIYEDFTVFYDIIIPSRGGVLRMHKSNVQSIVE